MSEEEREEILDLGFGSVVSRESTQRLLNRDGTFNVRRKGLGFFSSLSLYHFLINVLERTRVAFFPLAWTIVHPIDESSPLYGVTREEMLSSDAEFLVQLAGIDETFSQPVHARSSYTAAEVAFESRFADMFDHETGGDLLSVDVGRLHDVEAVD